MKPYRSMKPYRTCRPPPLLLAIALFSLIAAALTGCTKDASVGTSRAFAERDHQASAPGYETLVVPEGTGITAVLQTSLSTDGNSSGDPFVATTIEPIIVDGTAVAPAGFRIRGVLRDVQASGRIKDRARMTLVVQEIVDSAGKTRAISTVPLVIKAASERRNGVVKAASGGALGAIVGAITGRKNTAVIGSAAGADAETILVLANKGDDVELGPGLTLRVRTTSSTDFAVVTRE